MVEVREGAASCEVASSIASRYLFNLFVPEECRRQGLARRLVQSVCMLGNRFKPVFAACEPTPQAMAFWNSVGTRVEMTDVPLGLRIKIRDMGHGELPIYRVNWEACSLSPAIAVHTVAYHANGIQGQENSPENPPPAEGLALRLCLGTPPYGHHHDHHGQHGRDDQVCGVAWRVGAGAGAALHDLAKAAQCVFGCHDHLLSVFRISNGQIQSLCVSKRVQTRFRAKMSVQLCHLKLVRSSCWRVKIQVLTNPSPHTPFATP